MTSVTSKKIAYISAVQFKEAFYEPSPEIGYVFIGNHLAYPNEQNPVPINDTVYDEKSAWDNMIAAKKITGNDVELVIPRINWSQGTYYKQYDDLVPLESLATSDEQIVLSIAANTGAHGVNSFVTFTSSGANTSANARIYVNSQNAVVNIVVLSNGVYASGSTITARPNTGNATLTITTTTSPIKPMYVLTTDRNVYKCLSNNNSIPSTVEPRGDYTSSNGNIATSDGYIWKYMFNVKPSNRFLTDDWIPVPTSVRQLDYGTSIIDVIDGELTTIVVTNKGVNYYENDIRIIDAFNSGCTRLTLANTTNVAANMSITGTGITVGSHITSVNIVDGQPQLTLSTPTSSSGGSNTAANSAQLTTRIYIDGDGTSTVASASLNTVGNVDKITVTTIGTGYSSANVFIYGTGSNSAARAILDMKYGHAFNPAKELMSNSTMVCVRMGEIDTTEGGKISSNTTFRQYGIFVNPHKYGDANVANPANVNTVIAQTTTLTLVPGSSYSLDEFVYQGASPSNALAYGFAINQSSNELVITNARGTFETGIPVVGANTGVSRLLVGTGNPEFEPYSGDMLYIQNDVATRRYDGQAENIRLIVRF
jgi:hypothetical protein